MSAFVVYGSFELTIDPAGNTVRGVIADIELGSDNQPPRRMSDIEFTGVIDPSTNEFRGDVTATPTTSTRQSFGSDAKGVIVGRLFGPEASELGAVWTLGNGYDRVVGSLGSSPQ